ncbi:citrate lyase holo-[acyl-carrier protein] synthase [Celerinatantimonas diazotrophica]|uniref:citrate lyase holo-[acyl-carrier protein] synthase n=1 Tax=Celerinatantimonas diazotrophica TaxID=412034 RepID=A0A4R1K3W6_9GAMM|nr:citrate lyase holo-[acyl-carrier protein] synthase [Celerinatantimonas diazotrophica]TCK58784.1 holo-ACP synthase [Celerinatantimonas diazotrophica]CAG9297416.1 Apo-citrate lyase phosphoribosyl-dephospho-CoA transferase [Celerinatantimonas diazotrophica]
MTFSVGSEVSLNEMLARKETRVKQQQEWLKCHSLPLVSFTVNIPGSVKMNSSSQIVMKAGLKAIKKMSQQQGWLIVDCQKVMENTGPEAFIVIQAPSVQLLKKAMMTIETDHPLGRLMDLDVIDVDGKIISREDEQIAKRRCLICDEDAKVCARSRRHDLATLLAKIEQMTHDYECYD